MTGALLRWLDRIDVDQRRQWAARLLIWTTVLWALSHIGMAVLPEWFWKHVLLAISWAAIVVTAVDVIITSDVREQQED